MSVFPEMTHEKVEAFRIPIVPILREGEAGVPGLLEAAAELLQVVLLPGSQTSHTFQGVRKRESRRDHFATQIASGDTPAISDIVGCDSQT